MNEAPVATLRRSSFSIVGTCVKEVALVTGFGVTPRLWNTVKTKQQVHLGNACMNDSRSRLWVSLFLRSRRVREGASALLQGQFLQRIEEQVGDLFVYQIKEVTAGGLQLLLQKLIS